MLRTHQERRAQPLPHPVAWPVGYCDLTHMLLATDEPTGLGQTVPAPGPLSGAAKDTYRGVGPRAADPPCHISSSSWAGDSCFRRKCEAWLGCMATGWTAGVKVESWLGKCGRGRPSPIEAMRPTPPRSGGALCGARTLQTPCPALSRATGAHGGAAKPSW